MNYYAYTYLIVKNGKSTKRSVTLLCKASKHAEKLKRLQEDYPKDKGYELRFMKGERRTII